MISKYFTLFGSFLFYLFHSTPVYAQRIDKNFPEFNGRVNAIASSGDTTFIGGYFTWAYTGTNSAKFGSGISFLTGKPILNWPKPNKTVTAAVSDGTGGFYIAGTFRNIGDSSRYGLAHIDSTGKAKSDFRNLYIDNVVNDMHLQSDTLYLGGNFNHFGYIDSTHQSKLAVFDFTGQLKRQFPKFTGKISCAIPDSTGGWFIAGKFEKNGAGNSEQISRIDTFGNFYPWIQVVSGNLSYDATVTCLKYYNGMLFAGGNFAKVGGVDRTNIVCLNPQTGSLYNWAPNINNKVLTIDVHHDTVLIGGTFTAVNTSSNYQKFAAFPLHVNIPLAWNPRFDGDVNKIIKLDSVVYVCGNFTYVNGVTCCPFRGMAAFYVNSTTPLPWNLNLNGSVTDLVYDSIYFYLAGNFTSVNSYSRTGVAKIYKKDATVISNWAPKITDIPNNSGIEMPRLCFYRNKLVFAATFAEIDSIKRNYVVDIDTATGAVGNLVVNPNYNITTLANSHENLLTGGEFLDFFYTHRNNYLTGIKLTTGEIFKFDAKFNQQVYAIAASNNILVVGGAFTNVTGNPYLTTYSTNNFQLTKFNGATMNLNGWIKDIAISGNDVFFGGNFSQINATSRNNFASVNINTGSLNPINPNITGAVDCIKIFNNKIYLSGSFTYVGVSPRNGLAVLDQASGTLQSWISGSPYGTKLDIANNKVYVITANGTPELKALDINTGALISSWGLSGNGNVLSSIVAGPSCLYVTATENMGGESAVNLVAYYEPTQAILPSVSNVNGEIFCLLNYNGKLYCGGNFSSINGTAKNRLACLNLPTLTLTAFNANANSTVRCLIGASGRIFATGDFTAIGGTSRNYIAALDASTGTSISTWNPNASHRVTSMALVGNNLYVGGLFTGFGPFSVIPRNGLASIDATTGTVQNWNPQIPATSTLSSLTVAGNKIYAAGTFTTVGSANRNGYVSFNLNDTLANSWNPSVENGSNTSGMLTTDGKRIYIAANNNFIVIQNKPRVSMAVVDTMNGQLSDWNLYLNSGPSNYIAKHKSGVLFSNNSSYYFTNDMRKNTVLAELEEVPTINARQLSFTQITDTTIGLSWIPGNGSGRILVCRENNSNTGAPLNGISYTASPVFKMGDSIGSGSFVVYKGTGNSTVVRGLLPNRIYYFSLIECNGISNYHVYQNPIYLNVNTSTLPLKWIHVGANKIDEQQIEVRWTTTTEINNHHFEVERQSGFAPFETVGIVSTHSEGLQIKKYLFNDNLSDYFNWTSMYYRIRQVDKDGKTSFSNIVSVNNFTQKELFMVYPNPFEQSLNMNIPELLEDVPLEVFNLEGKCIYKKIIEKGQARTIQITTEDFPKSVLLFRFKNQLQKIIHE